MSTVHLGGQTLQRTDFRLDALMYACLPAILLRHPSWRPRLLRPGSPRAYAAILVATFRGSPFCFPVYVGLALLLAVASYCLIERPLISVGRRVAAKLT